MDNAPSNRVQAVKDLSSKYNVLFLYNVPGTPQLNIIEHLFEYIKRDIRLSSFISDFQTVKELLQKLKCFGHKNIENAYHREFFNYIKILKE